MAPGFSKDFIESLAKEPITDFTVKPGAIIGDNVAGELHAVQIQTVSGKTLNVVVKKLPDDNSAFKQYMVMSQTFALEIGVYTKLRESLENFIKSRGQENNFAVPFPAYFGGLCDGQNDFLSLEDVRFCEFKMPNKFVGLSVQETKLILKELAKFHALTYSLIKYEGEKFFERDGGIQKLNDALWDDPNMQAMMGPLFCGSLQNAIDFLQGRDEKLAEKVKNTFPMDKVVETFRSVRLLTDKKIFPVIIHGDFWVNNILIKYSEDGKEPLELKFVDFQQCRRGNLIEELLYFIFTSTTPELRATHLPQLLNLYFDTFTSSVSLLKSPVPPNFTRGTFLDMFNAGLDHAFLYAAFAIPLQLGDLTSTVGIAENEDVMMSPERLRGLMKGSPRAIDRLEAITREFVQLKIIN